MAAFSVQYLLKWLQLLCELLLSDQQLRVFDELMLRKSQSRVKQVDHVLHIIHTQHVFMRHT